MRPSHRHKALHREHSRGDDPCVRSTPRLPRLIVGVGALALTGCGTSGGGGQATDGGQPPGDARSSDSADATSVDTGQSDGPAASDASPDVSVPCGTSPWATIGHDGQRTSATDACVSGALTYRWRYVPVPPSGKALNYVFHAIAQSDATFLEWSAQDAQYVGTTAVDRVSIAGARVWTWDSGTDANLGHWLTLALGAVIANDDGLYYLDPSSGTKTHADAVDYWGQTASDAARLYVVNDSHVDGPGLFVAAYDAMAKQLWQANTYGMCRIDSGDLSGGAIAVDGGTLYYAAQYAAPIGVTLPFVSGVYAFDGASGTQKWFKPTSPISGISAGSGRVFLVEGTKLVARNEIDGAIAWTAAVTGAGVQAPAVAGSLVVLATQAGVQAFDAASGASRWSATVPGAGVPPTVITFTGGCKGDFTTWASLNVGASALPTTSLAVALASQTVVVTAPDGIHILALGTGMEVWKGAVAQATGRLRDPVLVGKRVYAMDDGALIALDAP
jgi:hypothetical protein